MPEPDIWVAKQYFTLRCWMRRNWWRATCPHIDCPWATWRLTPVGRFRAVRDHDVHVHLVPKS